MVPISFTKKFHMSLEVLNAKQSRQKDEPLQNRRRKKRVDRPKCQYLLKNGSKFALKGEKRINLSWMSSFRGHINYQGGQMPQQTFSNLWKRYRKMSQFLRFFFIKSQFQGEKPARFMHQIMLLLWNTTKLRDVNTQICKSNLIKPQFGTVPDHTKEGNSAQGVHSLSQAVHKLTHWIFVEENNSCANYSLEHSVMEYTRSSDLSQSEPKRPLTSRLVGRNTLQQKHYSAQCQCKPNSAGWIWKPCEPHQQSRKF